MKNGLLRQIYSKYIQEFIQLKWIIFLENAIKFKKFHIFVQFFKLHTTTEKTNQFSKKLLKEIVDFQIEIEYMTTERPP